jgi:hypothetical protein
MELEINNDEMDEDLANDPVNSLFFLKSGGARRKPLPFSDKLAVCIRSVSTPSISPLALVSVTRSAAIDRVGPRVDWCGL